MPARVSTGDTVVCASNKISETKNTVGETKVDLKEKSDSWFDLNNSGANCEAADQSSVHGNFSNQDNMYIKEQSNSMPQNLANSGRMMNGNNSINNGAVASNGVNNSIIDNNNDSNVNSVNGNNINSNSTSNKRATRARRASQRQSYNVQSGNLNHNAGLAKNEMHPSVDQIHVNNCSGVNDIGQHNEWYGCGNATVPNIDEAPAPAIPIVPHEETIVPLRNPHRRENSDTQSGLKYSTVGVYWKEKECRVYARFTWATRKYSKSFYVGPNKPYATVLEAEKAAIRFLLINSPLHRRTHLRHFRFTDSDAEEEEPYVGSDSLREARKTKGIMLHFPAPESDDDVDALYRLFVHSPGGFQRNFDCMNANNDHSLTPTTPIVLGQVPSPNNVCGPNLGFGYCLDESSPHTGTNLSDGSSLGVKRMYPGSDMHPSWCHNDQSCHPGYGMLPNPYMFDNPVVGLSLCNQNGQYMGDIRQLNETGKRSRKRGVKQMPNRNSLHGIPGIQNMGNMANVQNIQSMQDLQKEGECNISTDSITHPDVNSLCEVIPNCPSNSPSIPVGYDGGHSADQTEVNNHQSQFDNSQYCNPYEKGLGVENISSIPMQVNNDNNNSVQYQPQVMGPQDSNHPWHHGAVPNMGGVGYYQPCNMGSNAPNVTPNNISNSIMVQQMYFNHQKNRSGVPPPVFNPEHGSVQSLQSTSHEQMNFGLKNGGSISQGHSCASWFSSPGVFNGSGNVNGGNPSMPVLNVAGEQEAGDASDVHSTTVAAQ